MKAIELIIGKVWISYDDNGRKIGILQIQSDDTFIHLKNQGGKDEYTRDQVEQIFQLIQKDTKETESQLFGYPVRDHKIFHKDMIDELPCYKKTEISPVWIAAGYFGVLVGKVWQEKFCPKLSTLKEKEYVGPFKTKMEMKMATKKKNNEIDK